jgi:SHS2 domain-containing protein
LVPYRYVDDAPTADVGFVASGDTLEECLRAAADATLAVMLGNPESLRPHQQRTLHVESDSADLALLKLLEEIIYYKDAESLFLRVTSVEAKEQDGRWVVDAAAEGEAIDPSRHQLAGDVKAVTLHRLKVQRINHSWEATVVLDV